MTKPDITTTPVVLMTISGINDPAEVRALFGELSRRSLLRAVSTDANGVRNPDVTPLLITAEMSPEIRSELAQIAAQDIASTATFDRQDSSFDMVNEFISCERFFKLAQANCIDFSFPNTVAMIHALSLRAQNHGRAWTGITQTSTQIDSKFKKAAAVIHDQSRPLVVGYANFSRNFIQIMGNLFPAMRFTEQCHARAAAYRTPEEIEGERIAAEERAAIDHRRNLFEAVAAAAEPETVFVFPPTDYDAPLLSPFSPTTPDFGSPLPFESPKHKVASASSDAQTELRWDKDNINVTNIQDLETIATTLVEQDSGLLDKFTGRHPLKNCLKEIARVAAGKKREPNSKESVAINLSELQEAYEEMKQEAATIVPGAVTDSEPRPTTSGHRGSQPLSQSRGLTHDLPS